MGKRGQPRADASSWCNTVVVDPLIQVPKGVVVKEVVVSAELCKSGSQRKEWEDTWRSKKLEKEKSDYGGMFFHSIDRNGGCDSQAFV